MKECINETILEKYEFRNIRPEETDQVVKIEQICFPPNEACSEKDMKERILQISDLFLVAVDKKTKEVAGFLNGLATDEDTFRDEFFTDSTLNDPEGKNIMLLGLDVLPQHRGQGLARELLGVVDNEQKEVKRLLKTSSDGKMIQEGIQTVILGKPNAGKSSLLNLLIGENRAIVTDIAGTTRDILEEYITLHGISLKIIDTAGIRETKDIVEKIGVDRAREMAQKADLILYVVDSSVPLDENDEEIMAMLAGKKAIILYNKTDLQPVIQTELLKEKTGHPVIPISAKEEKGITELEEQIKEMFFGGEISFNDEVYITNARHKAALEEADKSLDLVRNSIEMGMPEDFFSIDLMNAYENLGKILGESVGEDLVNEIFSKFCMGK